MTMATPTPFNKISEELFKNIENENDKMLGNTKFPFCHYIEVF